MQELFSKLGLDWHLLLAQAANFLILLAVLYLALYKPLLKVLKDRRAKIQEGLMKAEEADTRLGEVKEMAKERLRKAEEESLSLIRSAEGKAKTVEAELIAEARKKEAALLANAERTAKNKEEEAVASFHKEAADLLRQALIKATAMHPDTVDEALITSAIHEIQR